MKNHITTALVLIYTTFFFGQRNEFNLIDLDASWGQEVLRFPARNMNYSGVGEVRFPPKGWRNPEHNNFWTYTYAWNIDVDRKITEKELATDLVKYFNSLNHIDMSDLKNKHYSYATITKIKQKKDITFFKGKVNIYDRFATHKIITLHVLIESHYCKRKKKTTLLFKFSPKGFKHLTWELLEKVKLIPDLCE